MNGKEIELLSIVTGVENLINVLDLKEDQYSKHCKPYEDLKGGTCYWFSFVCPRLKLEYEIIVNYNIGRLHITELKWNNYNTTVFLAILCGIVNNSGQQFQLLRISAEKISRLYYLCPLFGFTPLANDLDNIKRNLLQNKFIYRGIAHLFHTEEGLEYWLKNGIPFQCEFLLTNGSINYEFLKIELEKYQLHYWLK